MTDPKDYEKIKQSVRLLAANFNRRMDDETLRFWASRLSDHVGPRLWRALAGALDGETFPTLRWVCDQASESPRANSVRFTPDLTDEQRRRSDHAAIMSMLWMHYEKGWTLSDFSAHILGRLFGKDPRQALIAAKEIYDSTTVKRWIEDQQRAGN